MEKIKSIFKTETLANYRFLIPFFILYQFLTILIINLLIGRILQIDKLLKSKLQYQIPFNGDTLLSELFSFKINDYKIVYIIGLIVGLYTGFKTCYKLHSSFKNLAKGQKGTSRFATSKEIQEQYKAVPEKTERYEGSGGVLVSRTNYSHIQKKLLGKKDVLFVDDSPVNNVIIGATRSGKGENFIIPTIDVYSRAEKQPSLILNDPKGELAGASFETLKKRGYHVEVLNLLNPLESMSYNPLQLIIDAYKSGDYSEAQKLCNTLTYSLYMSKGGGGKDPFWDLSASSLVNAIILAICDRCIAEGTEHKITMYEVAGMLSRLGSDNYEVGDEEKNALDEYFKSLPPQSAAVNQYSTSNFAKGNTRASIFASAMAKLTIFTFDELAKMTSKNSFNFERVGFGEKKLKGKTVTNARVTVIFCDGSTEETTSNHLGLFEIPVASFDLVGKGKKITIETRSPDTTSVTVIEMLNRNVDTQVCSFFYRKSSNVSISEVVYFDKPIAVFMVVPDYDSSNHVIASIFVRQLYFVLAKKATLIGGKCPREVVFMLDEMGNMPAIEGFTNIITVCLGRNIRFNLIFQDYAQIEALYGKGEATIRGNCGNQIYILSNDLTTKQRFSKLLGEKTQMTYSRSGDRLSTKKSISEGVESRPLLYPDELNFQEGETVVSRVIKRRDLKGRKITPYPIFNTGFNVLKYRYEYLADDFDTSKSFTAVPIVSLHKDVNLMDLVIDFSTKPKVNQENKIESTPEPTEKEQKPRILYKEVLPSGMISKIETTIERHIESLGENSERYIEEFERIEELEELVNFLKQEDMYAVYDKVRIYLNSNETLTLPNSKIHM